MADFCVLLSVILLLIRASFCNLNSEEAELLAQIPWTQQSHKAVFSESDKKFISRLGKATITAANFQLELAIQRHSSNCMLPYWDNRLLKRSGPNPQHSVLFTPDLFGDANGDVSTGFAAGFQTTNSSTCMEISKNLSRAVPDNMEFLFNEDFTKFVSSKKLYKDLCTPWDDTFEDVHGGVHMFIGQLMSYLACAPCDPLFFFHHMFVDYVFEKHFRSPFKQKYPSENLTYPNISEKDLDDTYAGDNIMLPFGILHEDMLVDETFVPNYVTSPGDVKCTKDEDCCSNMNTEYIWCNTAKKHCAAKIRENGVVSAGFPNDACYCKSPKKPAIKNNICKCL